MDGVELARLPRAVQSSAMPEYSTAATASHGMSIPTSMADTPTIASCFQSLMPISFPTHLDDVGFLAVRRK